MSNFEFVSASGLVQLSHFHPVAHATGSSYVGLRPASISGRRPIQTLPWPSGHGHAPPQHQGRRPTQSSNPIDQLFASLQHRAFRGEL